MPPESILQAVLGPEEGTEAGENTAWVSKEHSILRNKIFKSTKYLGIIQK
jgi:hypothetical protein